MSQPVIGKKAPDFELPASNGQPFRLSKLKGTHVVLYFYPKDSTPGCTLEGQDFRDNHQKFTRRNTRIFGISRDSLKSHENFRTRQKFPFLLLSDAEETACKLYDVIRMKNMYGRKVRGIERSTFLVDAGGKLVKEWRKVSVKGHVDEVLDAVKTLVK
ncbi:MAG TPA: peroxiredoxin [Gammaproteobacteria bacterium]|nr:peroxiredoxin [Gammaproteobacteria bacterium]